MLYPFGGECDTQPLIDVHNITLTNVQAYGTVLPPGVIRCHESNPCTGFEFNNVKSHGWWRVLGLNYVVENVVGTETKSRPVPAFKDLDGNYIESYEGGQFNFSSVIQDRVMPFVQEMLGEDHYSPSKLVKSFSTVYAGFINK